jgi:transposase-like protein
MVPEEFQEYFRSVSSEVQNQIIESLLIEMDSQASIKSSSEKSAVHCPHCKGEKVLANGKFKAVQRYICKGCGKHFSENTGKVWYNLKKKDKVNTYMYCLLSGFSIRKSAEVTKVSIQTAFDWRHKILTSFSSAWTEGFEGIVESDDMFFLQSDKGNKKLERKPRKRGGAGHKRGISEEQVAVIATCDRSGNKDFKVAALGRIKKQDIDAVLAGKLEKAEALCTDSHRSYSAFAKAAQVPHKKFNASKGQRVTEKVYHVQNVNNMDMRLRKWIQSFNGVATKYLQNYLNWFLVLEKIKHNTRKLAVVSGIMFTSNTTWFEYKQEVYHALIRI